MGEALITMPSKRSHRNNPPDKLKERLYSVEVIPIKFIVHNCSSKRGALSAVQIFGRKDMKYKVERIQ